MNVLLVCTANGGRRSHPALALRCGDIGERTILVDGAVAFGDVKATKTGKRRSVRLLALLAADLAEWRFASRRPDETALIASR